MTPPATATEQVYRGIHAAVTERRLAPGEWLREEELAAAFGVSRTVVRQALQRLAQDQVVELHHNRGARVPLPGLEEAAHVFEARRVAECEIARRLGGRLDEAQRERLRRLVADEAAATASGDHAQAARLSGEFHLALAAMHGNPILTRMLDALLPITSVLVARFTAEGRPVCVAHRHVDLLQSLAQGPRQAAAEMKQHLDELERSLTCSTPPERPLRDAFARYRDDDAGAPPA